MKTILKIIVESIWEATKAALSEEIFRIFIFSCIWGLIFGWNIGIITFCMVYFIVFSQVIYDAIKRYEPNKITITDATINTRTLTDNTK